MPTTRPRATDMRYYPIQRNWSARIAKHTSNPEFLRIMTYDLNKMTSSRWHRPFTLGMLPRQVDFTCDWRRESGHRGRQPAFWDYVRFGACHWLVNSTLRLAMLSEPDRQWRVVTSHRHSTVWDGAHILFDLQYSALNVPPDECWKRARWQGQVMYPGAYRPTYRLEFWHTELQRNQREERKNRHVKSKKAIAA